MLRSLQAKIVLPLVGVFLLTVAAGYWTASAVVEEDSRRRGEELARRQGALEGQTLGAARALARFSFFADPAPGTTAAQGRLRDAAAVLGRPFAVLDETGLLAAVGGDDEAAALRAGAEDLWRLVRTRPEGVGDIVLAGRRSRAVWTPIPPLFFVRPMRPRTLVTVLPAGLPADEEHPLVRPFAGIALAGATALALAGYVVSLLPARRVAALTARVEAWRPAGPATPATTPPPAHGSRSGEPSDPTPPPATPATPATSTTTSTTSAAPAPTATPSSRPHGDEIQRLAAAFEDLRRRLEQSEAELLARERLAVAGRISAMMAHEIRNPLTALKLSVQLLRGDVRDPESAETIEVMLREIGRLQILCDQLLTLSRRRAAHPGPVPLHEVVRDVCRLLGRQAEQGRVTLAVEVPDAGMPPLRADGDELRQLLMNLLLNALAVAPSGSTIRVRAAHDPAAGSWSLAVEDRGPGVDDATATALAAAGPDDGGLPRAGDRGGGLLSHTPGGAGLGLVICRTITDRHGGSLRLRNRGDGTTAEVVLRGMPEG